jgi:hypothetical protein
MYNFLVGTRRHFLKTDASSDHTGNGKQNYFRTGKGRARVAGGARARRCELRDGVAGRASLQHCFNRRPRDHGAQAVGGSAGGGNRGAAGKPRCATEREIAERAGVSRSKRAAHRGRRAPAEGWSGGAADRAYGTRAAPFTLGAEIAGRFLLGAGGTQDVDGRYPQNPGIAGRKSCEHGRAARRSSRCRKIRQRC